MNTIPGGAYLDSDKRTWRDANGKVIKAPNLSELYRERDELQELEAGEITPGARMAGDLDEYGKTQDPETVEEKPRSRSSKKKTSGED
jgi:hypothetical protein